MRVQIISTSCTRRELELEQVKDFFKGNGCEISNTDFETDQTADYILLSTCGFTMAAEEFGLKTLSRIENEKKPECEIIVGGCLPKISPEPLQNYRLFDPRSYEKLDEYFSFEKKFNEFPRPNTIGEWKIHTSYREHGLMSADVNSLDETGKKTREDNIKNVEKISEVIGEKDTNFRVQCLLGCACKCTYCAIKFAIGPIKSRSIDEITNEIKIGIEKGYKSILLEGDSLGGYGLDIKTNLGALLDRVIELVRDTDVQVSVPDVSPKYLNICSEQIMQLANMKKIFHLYTPVQSGSQRILDLMERDYDIVEAKEIIKNIRNSCPGLKIGTSIIVGFPGETEEDFLETIKVCKDIKFNYIWTHFYSDRKGTKASTFTDKIPKDIILSRARRLKDELRDCTEFVTIPENQEGSRSCQG